MRIIDWKNFTSGICSKKPLALSIGVFDGVHRGHQVLIRRIFSAGSRPAVITFRQNPLKLLKPALYKGDIFSLRQKLAAFQSLGVGLTVLIDFSVEFSKMMGKDFIDALIRNNRVESIALGVNFRCGRGLDTGVQEFCSLTEKDGIKILAVEPVMAGTSPVSSSRIREAVSGGNLAEASELLGRNVEIDLSGLPANVSFRGDSAYFLYDARNSGRVVPPSGNYRARTQGVEAVVSVENGIITVPESIGRKGFGDEKLEFLAA